VKFQVYLTIKQTIPLSYSIEAADPTAALEKAVNKCLREFGTDDNNIIESIQVDQGVKGSPGQLGEEHPYREA